MKRKPIGRFLAVDPNVCHGKLTFAGTRVPVQTVLHYLSRGKSLDSILTDWPELTREAIEEAIELASAALDSQFAARAKAP